MRALLLSATLLLLLALLHVTALDDYWYWRYPWVDMIAHGMGGVSLALFSYWALTTLGKRPSMPSIMVLVLVVGVCWELFEYEAGLTREIGYAFDTAKDITMDLLGGIIGSILIRSL